MRVQRKLMAASPIVAAMAVWAVSVAQDMGMSGHSSTTPDAIVWGDPPPMLPAGAKVAVLDGDPAKTGEFTMRIKVPAGYVVPPHYHPADEHVTIIQGTLYMGLGNQFDEAKCDKLTTGSFAMMKKGVRHFAMAGNTETIVQVHGLGPWGITFVNPDGTDKLE